MILVVIGGCKEETISPETEAFVKSVLVEKGYGCDKLVENVPMSHPDYRKISCEVDGRFVVYIFDIDDMKALNGVGPGIEI